MAEWLGSPPSIEWVRDSSYTLVITGWILTHFPSTCKKRSLRDIGERKAVEWTDTNSEEDSSSGKISTQNATPKRKGSTLDNCLVVH